MRLLGFKKWLYEQEKNGNSIDSDKPSPDDIKKEIEKLEKKGELTKEEEKELEELKLKLKELTGKENPKFDKTPTPEKPEENIPKKVPEKPENDLEGLETGAEEELEDIEEEDEDFTIIPYSEKIKIAIELLKEFGYSTGLEYKIENGQNTVTVDGKITKDLRDALKDFGKELEIDINIEETSVDKNDFLTQIHFVNKMDFNKFKDIIKLSRKKESESPLANDDTPTVK